jgi:Flp pilus assembly protein TadB
MNERARVDDYPPFEAADDEDEFRSASIRRRRAEAAAARRRRLMLVDLGIGLVLALFVILLLPGLAIVAIVLIGAVVGLAGWTVFSRVRRRRAEAEPRSMAPRGARGRGASERHG